MNNHFVIGVYGFKNCSPIHLDGKTLAEAKRAVAWQGVGSDLKDKTTFHICTPVPDVPGTFASVDTGAHFAANTSGWTPEAWKAFLARTWPAATI